VFEDIRRHFSHIDDARGRKSPSGEASIVRKGRQGVLKSYFDAKVTQPVVTRFVLYPILSSDDPNNVFLSTQVYGTFDVVTAAAFLFFPQKATRKSEFVELVWNVSYVISVILLIIL